MKQETKRKIEISNLHEFADSLILIDNRIDRCKKHQASTIVLIAISAVICGADTWNSIEDFGKSKESFFAAKLSNFNGIPSHDTFNRFFSALDPLKFEESYRQWVQSILKFIGITTCSTPVFPLSKSRPIPTMQANSSSAT